ncbi:BnaC02g34960D [Brassica napus]|nr:BnaC02g34960D [Brassica napus]
MSDEEAPKWVTPLSSFKPGDWRTPTLKDMELPEDRVNDEDYSLVFVPEDSWAKLIHWCSTTKQ